MTEVAADPALAARLAGLVTLAEFEPLARLAMEPGAYDYVAGGAGTRSPWPRTSLPGDATGSAHVSSSMCRR